MVENLSWDEKLQLQEWIAKGSKTFKLLFSIRRGGWDPATFHRLCDSNGPTVTVLYNTNDSVFGGYTSIEWKSQNCYKEDNNAFLFQLRFNGNPMANKFPLRNGKKAINDGKSYGPYFGSRPNLFTFKNTVKSNEEYFSLSGKMKCSTFDLSVCVTQKKINNDHMHVKELEVYKVQGPICAGKSSFINTIYSTFNGYYTTAANSGSAEKSLTTRNIPDTCLECFRSEDNEDSLDLGLNSGFLSPHVSQEQKFSSSTHRENVDSDNRLDERDAE